MRRLDLGYHLVASAGNVESIDISAPEERTQIRSHLLEVESQVRHPVPVDAKQGLGLVDLDIDNGREGEHPALNGP